MEPNTLIGDLNLNKFDQNNNNNPDNNLYKVFLEKEFNFRTPYDWLTFEKKKYNEIIENLKTFEEKFETYKMLLKTRHDLLHFMLTFSLFGKWVPEQRMRETIQNYVGYGMNKTPDIFYEYKGKNYLIDVSVTSKDISQKHSDKVERYKQLAIGVASHTTMETVVYPVIFKSNGDNATHVLSDFLQTFNSECDVNFVHAVLGFFEEMYKKIIVNVDQKLFEEKKMSEFNFKPDYTHLDTKIDIGKMQKISKKKYPHDLKINLNREDIEKLIMSNHEKNHKDFMDMKMDPRSYTQTFQKLQDKNDEYPIKIRPTIHNLFSFELFDKPQSPKREQEMVMSFIVGFITDVPNRKTEPSDYLLDLFIKINDCMTTSLDAKINDTIFNEGHKNLPFYQDYKNWKQKLNPFNQNDKRFSKREYYRNNGFLKSPETETTYAVNQKTFRVVENLGDTSIKLFYSKSGVDYYKFHKTFVRSMEKTTPLTECKAVDDVIGFFCEDSEIENTQLGSLYDFLINKDIIIEDSITMSELRALHVEQYQEILLKLLKKNTAKYLWFQHLFYSQLMHILSLNSKNNEYTLFNCGNPNFLCLVTGGYKSTQDKAQKAFLTIIKTTTPDKYNNIFGNITKIKCGRQTYIITGWRRLSVDKCTFMRDSFYSVLSSTMNLYFDLRDPDDDYLFKMFAIKALISTTTSQQIQEFLMDNRYAYMSAFSSYTNIGKLLEEKFKPPYDNCLSVWIINRLFTRLPQITGEVLSGSAIKMFVPDYSLDQKRKEGTLGGIINIASLWTDYRCKNIDQVLEEAFIYVHTMKEPASAFHEKIKAVNTIKKYEKEYQRGLNYGYMNPCFGWVNDEKSFDFFNDYHKICEIGFSSSVVYHSFKNLMEIIKPNFEKIVNNVLKESIGELASTKSVIHSLKRTIEVEHNKHKRESIVKRFAKRLDKVEIPKEKQSEIIENMPIYTRHNDSKFYRKKDRQKVWETIIDFLVKNPTSTTVEDLCKHFVEEEEAEVEADICIKAQYGAKREFYVVNIGAKAMARIVEKFFQNVAEECQTECISVPGDRKMLNMQKNLDDAHKYASLNKLKIRYVNGDCTKWSAAETMGSFLSMVEALRGLIPDGFYELLKLCFSTWADKKINIPFELYNDVLPVGEKTEYLRGLDENKKYIESHQNFLQGMFNYASSLKASSCNYYTMNIWSKMFPNSKLKSFHLEHSDDYVQVIAYDTDEEFERFRSFYKYMMRLHGYNDSTRKTSCQQLFMEFVSLMSFNGKMLYPKIKKAKEVNLSLPCTGYKDDMEAALSRQGECMRVGCNLSFSYFFSKLHTYCVAEAYSTLPKMRNQISEAFSKPIELFGIPDQLPIFSMLCRGNINNYRLLHYSVKGAELIKRLYLLNIKYKGEEDLYRESNEDFHNYLMSPLFEYDTYNGVLKLLRKNIDVTIEESREFWKNNQTYRFIKPTTNEILVKWMKLMFFNRGFTEAYTKLNRSAMTMRLSHFVSNRCIKLCMEGIIKPLIENQSTEGVNSIKDSKIYESLNISEYCKKILNDDLPDIEVDTKTLNKVVLRSDPTATAIYSIISNSIIHKMPEMPDKYRSHVPTFLPQKIGWFYVENNPAILVQRLYNPENYYADNRKAISEISMMIDIKTIKENYKINENPSAFEIQELYNDLTTIKGKKVVYMGFTATKHTLIDTITDQFSYNLSNKNIIRFESRGVSTIINPRTSLPYYIGTRRHTENTAQQCLENMAIMYSFFKLRLGYGTTKIIDMLDNMNFHYKAGNQEYLYSYKDILELFNPTSAELTQLPEYLLKTAAFLRFVLLFKDDLVKKISNDIYSYSYEYTKSGTKNDNRYQGRTECLFNYLNYSFKFTQNNNDIPVLYTNTDNVNINKSAYMISLALSNNLHKNELFKNIISPDISKFYGSFKPEETVRAQLSKNVVNKEFFDYKNTQTLGFPIFLKRENIMKPSAQKKNLNLVEQLHIINHDDYNLKIKLDRKTLYTLPYWACKQINCISAKKDIPILGIKISVWLKKLLFKKFISMIPFHKEEIKDYDITEESDEVFTELLKLKNEIKEIKPKEKPKKTYGVEVNNMFEGLNLDMDSPMGNFMASMGNFDFLNPKNYVEEEEGELMPETGFLIDTFDEIMEPEVVNISTSVDFTKTRLHKETPRRIEKKAVDNYYHNQIRNREGFREEYVMSLMDSKQLQDNPAMWLYLEKHIDNVVKPKNKEELIFAQHLLIIRKNIQNDKENQNGVYSSIVEGELRFFTKEVFEKTQENLDILAENDVEFEEIEEGFLVKYEITRTQILESTKLKTPKEIIIDEEFRKNYKEGPSKILNFIRRNRN